VGVGDPAQHRLLGRPAPGQRAVGGEHVAHLLRLLNQLALVEEGVVLDLVAEDGGDLGGLAHHRRGEVADADVADLAGLLQLQHGAEGLLKRHLGVRPMQQEEIDPLGLEVLEAALGGLDQALVGEIGRPDLGGEENGVAVHPGFADAAADLGLVVVHAGGVDVAVAELKGVGHGPLAVFPLQPPGAEPERRHLFTLRFDVLHALLR
jgi:hypothetical protein